MALNKVALQKAIADGFYNIFLTQAQKAVSGDENENEKPEDVIKKISTDMANVVTNAVDTFVREGDVIVGDTNIIVVSSSPGSLAKVTPVVPAKMT